jgi:LysM repeat protein
MRVGHPLFRVLLTLAIILTAFGRVGVRPANAQGNLLQNPGFEGDYVPFNGDVSRLVAPGWQPWNVGRASGDPTWKNIQPQYLPASNPNRVRSGSRAQEIFELYATFTGGVYQQVASTPGAPLRFSAHLNTWSTTRDDPNQSLEPSALSLQVGIDPTGGTNGASNAIVWSASEQFYDEYRRLSVDAISAGTVVTVFVRATIREPVRNNHVYIDDAALVLTGDGGVTATPSLTPSATVPSAPSATFTASPTLDFTIPTREGPTNTPGGPTNTPFVPTAGPSITPGGPTATLFIPTVSVPSATPDVFQGLPGRLPYVVVRGDTVSGLAARFQSRVEAIIVLNQLPPTGLIIVGQNLIIPVPTPGQATVVPTGVPTLPPVGVTPPVLVAPLNGPTTNGIGTYIMQPGDTLEAVAQRYRVSVAELSRLNGIVNPRTLVIGQVLAVPGPGNNPPGGTRAPTIIPTQPGGGVVIGGVRYHIVQRGENLFRISLRYNVTLAALMAANGIFNPNLIFVGQRLRIP